MLTPNGVPSTISPGKAKAPFRARGIKSVPLLNVTAVAGCNPLNVPPTADVFTHPTSSSMMESAALSIVPVPFQTAQIYPSGCDRTHRLKTLPAFGSDATAKRPLMVAVRLSAPLFCSVNA